MSRTRDGAGAMPDLCVIGAGAAGLSVAAIGASLGASVVLVQRDAMGGDCLNAGCVPSKALIAAAARAQAIRSAGAFGIAAGEPEVRAAGVRDHVRGVIDAIAPNDSEARFTAMGVRVIRAEARFAGPHAVVAGGEVIRARRFVLAVGSRPAVPPVPGLDGVPYLTNETVFDLGEVPGRLLVLGGGPVGAELGQAFRRLGAEVAVVTSGRFLAREDPEMAAVIARRLRAEGIEIIEEARVARAGARAGRVVLGIDDGAGPREIEGSHLLVAAGRHPVTEGLGLEAAGIAAGPDGIRVDRGLRTANRRVYAVGDCAGGEAGGLRFTHVAGYHAGLAVRSALFRLPVRVDLSAIPRATYTDPELASVGMDEAGARAAGRPFRILRWPFSENDRAQAERDPEGLVKAIVTPRGRVLGCSIAGPRAGELITPWTLAVAKRLHARDLAALVFPYPTLSEATKRAAVEHLRPQAANPWLRRLLALLRALG